MVTDAEKSFKDLLLEHRLSLSESDCLEWKQFVIAHAKGLHYFMYFN